MSLICGYCHHNHDPSATTSNDRLRDISKKAPPEDELRPRWRKVRGKKENALAGAAWECFIFSTGFDAPIINPKP